ncbi:MAG: MoxR family ATPase [Myxococcales bacterium]|nr:MoxR family ATPase [Myxococcales bacterium]
MPSTPSTSHAPHSLSASTGSTRTQAADRLYLLYEGQGRAAGSAAVTRGERGAYLADVRLRDAVRTAVALEKPLLVTGEPGCGKTALAWSVASELGLGEPLTFHTRSDHHAVDVLYSFDHILRFFDAQTQEERAKSPENYIKLEALGRAIVESDPSPRGAEWRARLAQDDGIAEVPLGRRVVLIDEIDKAPRDFPNDLLDEFDRMQFRVKEKPGLRFTASLRPIVIITSNSERQLPDPFLRRCVYHGIDFPDPPTLEKILRQRIAPDLPDQLVQAALDRFRELRQRGEEKLLEKKPATAELEAWVRMLLLARVPVEKIAESPLAELPNVSVLIKTEKDLTWIRKQTTR